MKHNRIRRLICLVLAFVLVLGNVPSVSAYESSRWSSDEMAEMVEEGIFPTALLDWNLKDNIPRKYMAEAAVLAYEALIGKEAELPDHHPFTDTQDPYVEKAYALGILNGMGDGTFCPDEYLTRQQSFSLMYNFMLYTGMEITEDMNADLSRFEDEADLSKWAVRYAKACVGVGVVIGDDQKMLLPKDYTSCEEALAMFYRCYLLVKNRNADITTEYPNLEGWAAADVQAMDEMGLIPASFKGTDMQSAITRADACYMAVDYLLQLWMVEDIPLMGEAAFSDTTDKKLLLAAEMGLVEGYADGTFRPNEAMTREDIFYLIVGFLNFMEYPYTDNDKVDLKDYPDAAEVSVDRQAATRLLLGIGVLVVEEDAPLAPLGTAQYQEFLSMYYRVYNYVQTWTYDYVEEVPSTALQLVEKAKEYLGYRYRWGAEHPSDGFDCSGLVYYLYHDCFGYTIGRTAGQQWKYGKQVQLANLQPGDLVFFSSTYSLSSITHVGIYIGNDQFIHAANSTRGVVIDYLTGSSYYRSHFVGARRLIEE